MIVPLAAGAICGAGALVALAGWRGMMPTPTAVGAASARENAGVGLFADPTATARLVGAVSLAVVIGLLSGWPVGIVGGAAAGAAAPSLATARRRRQETMQRVEGVAAWCEQLRDIIGASAGLQEAITASARVAPTAIRPAVQSFAADQRRLPFAAAARRFADAIADPVGDQVSIALTLAAERRGQSLAAVLHDVATAAREEAVMLDRTETARARSYNEALAVTAIVLAMFVGLLAFNRDYLRPFDTISGQLVLAVIGAGWATAFASLISLSAIRRPDRLLSIESAPTDLSAPTGVGR
ncbi:MAG: type II secretion system F family protein [Acidimicrobiales bacterium]